ncbi:MAG: hypothetical protein ACI4UN_03285 [Muribaculaceae bacterium]
MSKSKNKKKKLHKKNNTKLAQAVMPDTFISEDHLIELHQEGKISLVFYVTHLSPETREEYFDFCRKNNIPSGKEESAEQYLCYRENRLIDAIEEGNI